MIFFDKLENKKFKYKSKYGEIIGKIKNIKKLNNLENSRPEIVIISTNNVLYDGA